MRSKIIIGVSLVVALYAIDVSGTINVAARNFSKMNLVLVLPGNDPVLRQCAQIMRHDFSFSGQFDVSIELCKTRPSKKLFKEWQKQGKLLAVFLNTSEQSDALEWRLYDTSNVKMLKGKKYTKRGSSVRGWAHNIADMIWPEIMGQESSFSTRIAFSKDVKSSHKHNQLHVYIADYDGSNREPLVTTPTINVAPRWNRDVSNPLLFYSESAQANISLRVVDMRGRRKVASNFDGLNMLPTFSKNGKKVVYCMSHGDGNCHLYAYEKGTLKQLTHNNGNNISPSVSGDGNRIYFCSDYKKGIPLIYCYDCIDGSIEQLTDSGPCFSPSYCEKNNKLAYIKRVDGVMQIVLYDLNTQKHMQFTTDENFHKEECVWSPCGNYLLFCLTAGSSSRLAVEHVVTHNRHLISRFSEQCSYPSWSPQYQEYPCVKASGTEVRPNRVI